MRIASTRLCARTPATTPVAIGTRLFVSVVRAGCAAPEPIVTPRIAQLTAAIEHQPEERRLYSDRACACSSVGEHRAALRDLARAKGLGPTVAATWWAGGVDPLQRRRVHRGAARLERVDRHAIRTVNWMWHEKETIYELHSAWQRAYRERPLPRSITLPTPDGGESVDAASSARDEA